LGHARSQTQRAHVSPHFLDVVQTFGLGPALSSIVPAERIRPVHRPDRILLFVVYNNFVNGIVSLFRRCNYGFSCLLFGSRGRLPPSESHIPVDTLVKSSNPLPMQAECQSWETLITVDLVVEFFMSWQRKHALSGKLKFQTAVKR